MNGQEIPHHSHRKSQNWGLIACDFEADVCWGQSEGQAREDANIIVSEHSDGKRGSYPSKTAGQTPLSRDSASGVASAKSRLTTASITSEGLKTLLMSESLLLHLHSEFSF